MSLAEIKARPSMRDRAKIAVTTEADIRRQMIEDGENPDEELSESDVISPWYIRKRLKMSQREFADTLGIPVATLRNWERTGLRWSPRPSR
jgi:DNA-binding transcriptional regulator YiaG